MYIHAYIYIQIYTKICAYIYVFMCQSNESEKSRSFLSATTILTKKYPQYLILAVSEFSISISNDAL